MSLEHELRVAGARVPELDAAILRPGEDPFRVGGERDAEDEVLWQLLAGWFDLTQ